LRAATNFAAVCAKGDATALYNASLWLDDCFDGWRFAMLKVARLEKVSQEIQQAFVPIWVEHKTLPLKVAERSVLAKALRVLMPGGYSGAPLRLYRGANARERRRRIYGFSWTTDITIARNFVWFSTDAFKQRCRQSRLSNTWLTGQQHRLPFAALRFRPAPQQQVEFFFPTDKVSHACRVESVEAAFDGRWTQGRPSRRIIVFAMMP
jgi:hypothetical protein